MNLPRVVCDVIAWLTLQPLVVAAEVTLAPQRGSCYCSERGKERKIK